MNRLRVCLAFAAAAPAVALFSNPAAAAQRFLASQAKVYAGQKDAAERPWIDLCQMVMASNPFLYVE